MLPIVLIGNEKDRTSYLENFIQQLGARPYDIIKYDHTVGIADVRYVQKMLSFKLEEGRVRLIIFPHTITIEAQNALLKTLEEVSPNVQILINTPSKDVLLPTMVSRAKVVLCPRIEEKDTDKDKSNAIQEILLAQKNWDVSLPFTLEDGLPGLITKEPRSVEELILTLRGIIIEKIVGEKQDRTDYVTSLFLLLKKLSYVYPLIIRNNVNQRFALETILLSIITTWES